MRTFLSVLLGAHLALLAACGPTPPAEPTRCSPAALYDGVPTEGLVVGEMRGGAFVPFAAGGDAHFVFGFQGGTMIQPVVSIPVAFTDERCVEIALENSPDPAFPGAAGELIDYRGYSTETPLTVVGDALRSEPLPDLVGFAAPEGVRMILDATVRGAGFALHTSIPLRLTE